MKSRVLKVVIYAVVTLSSFFFCVVLTHAELQNEASATVDQKAFDTPDAALSALIKAAASYDVPELKEIFGPEGEDLISSADPVRDRNNVAEFVRKAQEKHRVEIEKKDKNRAIVSVGADDWPLPIPLVKKNAKWYFDTKAGREEVLLRRIGANELDAIQVCRGYVDAQREYAAEAHDGINQYAQRIISSSGKQDGLYWVNPDGTSGGPISEGIARAIQEGYSTEKGPYHGYYFKILKGQGPGAQLGRIDYVIQGVMIGGFALVAVPAEYRVTGVQTFIVNQDGVVYQKDLGSDSLKIAKEMELYDPDKSWRPTQDQWPSVAAQTSSADTKP